MGRFERLLRAASKSASFPSTIIRKQDHDLYCRQSALGKTVYGYIIQHIPDTHLAHLITFLPPPVGITEDVSTIPPLTGPEDPFDQTRKR